MAIHTYFPSFVYVQNLKFKEASVKKMNAEILNEVLTLRKIDKEGKLWSLKNYPAGYTSYSSYSQLHLFSSTFADLKVSLDQEAAKFAKYLEMDLRGKKLCLTNLWANVMTKGSTHTMHLHPLSTISGTYYVQTPTGCSGLKFEDPRLSGFMASPPRKAKARPENQRFVVETPKAGQVILFESWMRHEVPTNSSTQSRISLSFNYDWI